MFGLGNPGRALNFSTAAHPNLKAFETPTIGQKTLLKKIRCSPRLQIHMCCKELMKFKSH